MEVGWESEVREILRSRREGAWNKGLTADMDERVRKNVESMAATKRRQGGAGEVVPWNKGLTKETSSSVAMNAKGTKKTRSKLFAQGKLTVWNKGLTKAQDSRVARNAESLVRAYAEGRAQSHGQTTKGGYREDLGHYTRSSWEANFARLVKFLGLDYEYELHRFEFETDSKVLTYLPDFHIPELGRYVEVKGFWREADWGRVCLFRSAFPEVKLDVIDAGKYSRLSEKFSKFIPNWEYP